MTPRCNLGDHLSRRAFLKGAAISSSGLVLPNWGGLAHARSAAECGNDEARVIGKDIRVVFEGSTLFGPEFRVVERFAQSILCEGWRVLFKLRHRGKARDECELDFDGIGVSGWAAGAGKRCGKATIFT